MCVCACTCVYCMCAWEWVGRVGEGGSDLSYPTPPTSTLPQPCCLSPGAGGRYGGFVAEAVRGACPSPCFPSVCTHTPLPSSLRKRCLLGGLAAGRGVRLSFSLWEQVGGSPSGLRVPLLSTPNCLQPRLHRWLGGLRPPTFPVPGLSRPLPGQPVLPSNCQAGVWPPVCLSALPAPTPRPLATCSANQLPSASLQPPTPHGSAGLLLPGCLSTNCTSQRLT